MCRTCTDAPVCVSRITIFQSPLPEPISKFSFDALPAPRVPAGDGQRLDCALSGCPGAGSLALGAPGQVHLRPCAGRCVLTAADTAAFATAKFMETWS